jgi:hypothetical protein
VENNDLINFLKLLVPDELTGVPAAGGAIGGFVYISIETIDLAFKRFGVELSGNLKLGMSMAGSVLVPATAFGLLVALGAATVGPNAIFLVAATAAWVFSKVVHDGLDGLVRLAQLVRGLLARTKKS